MFVNIEFLGDEPLENLITSLNFKVDKTIYFGFSDVINKHKDYTQSFLRKYCGVDDVVFCQVAERNLDDILRKIRYYIEEELAEGNKIFFDISGGDSMFLVAFGMLAKEFNLPMHAYDIPNNKLIECGDNTIDGISKCCKKREIEMNLDIFIEMYGAKINKTMQKNIKADYDEDYLDTVERVWRFARKNITKWNSFSSFLKSQFDTDVESGLSIRRRVVSIEEKLKEHNSSITNIRNLNDMLGQISKAGLIRDYRIEDDRYFFRYESEDTKNILMDGGSAFELHIFNKERKNADDCQIGVHIDWDGVFDPDGRDVLNEVDVLKLNGYIPTFISCKTGSMESSKALMALYELETVAKRFGGKYAKKVLCTAQPMGDIYLKRAKEMDVEVRNE